MSRTMLALAAVAAVAACAIGAGSAEAQHFRGGGGHGAHGFKSGAPAVRHIKPGFHSGPIRSLHTGFNPANPLLSSGHRFKHGHVRDKGFGFFGVGGGTSVVVVTPPAYGAVAYDPPVVYEPTPVYYAQPIVTAPVVAQPVAVVPPPPAAPPTPTVVEFPTGRYELRGDGVSVPYSWVWIPNPPAAPPPGAATEPPPAAPTRRAKLYRWTDDQGVIHLTDQAETVPDQYRDQRQPS